MVAGSNYTPKNPSMLRYCCPCPACCFPRPSRPLTAFSYLANLPCFATGASAVGALNVKIVLGEEEK